MLLARISEVLGHRSTGSIFEDLLQRDNLSSFIFIVIVIVILFIYLLVTLLSICSISMTSGVGEGTIVKGM